MLNNIHTYAVAKFFINTRLLVILNNIHSHAVAKFFMNTRLRCETVWKNDFKMQYLEAYVIAASLLEI